jgi:hypothetical protein
MAASDEIFAQTRERLAAWQADSDVLGVLLVGSKSRGHMDGLSDDDLEVLLSDEAHARLTPSACSERLVDAQAQPRRLVYDAQYLPLSHLAERVESPLDLDHWPYERARVLFARDGRVEAAVKALGSMPAAFRRLRLLHAAIDAHNAALRAEKTLKRGYAGSARMLVARAARALTRVVFALEGRWVPLDHWLEPELATLADGAQAGPALLEAMETGAPGPILEALKRLQPALAQEGYPAPEGRVDLFLALVHPSRAAERAIHGLA